MIDCYQVTYDGEVVADEFDTVDEAWLYVLRHQGQSVMYALRNGWDIRPRAHCPEPVR